MTHISNFGSEIKGPAALPPSVLGLEITSGPVFDALARKKATPGEAPECAPTEPPEALDPALDPTIAFLCRVLPERGPYAVRGLKKLIKKDHPAIKEKGAKPSKVI